MQCMHCKARVILQRQENIKLGVGVEQATKNRTKILFFVDGTDGVSTKFGHNMKGLTETACPWLIAFDCFPWWLNQASKVTFKNSCFGQIWSLSFSSRRNSVSVIEKLGCSRRVNKQNTRWVKCSLLVDCLTTFHHFCYFK